MWRCVTFSAIPSATFAPHLLRHTGGYVTLFFNWVRQTILEAQDATRIENILYTPLMSMNTLILGTGFGCDTRFGYYGCLKENISFRGFPIVRLKWVIFVLRIDLPTLIK